ncbi:hypothetical protein BDZ45DRAFT_34237 [Acephala macrosclerotiorum]|nr:hypothetical protein BDZ45DRAFT_34237 [Acephala macrosclerotiorum]
MIATADELAFRLAVYTPIRNPDPKYAQVVPCTGQRTMTVYQSNYTIMAIAILINFLGLLSALPLYYGWWELGRKASLSVLETAKAFEAPLLRDVDDNATVEQILKQVGKTRAVYGEVVTLARASTEFLIPRKEIRRRLQIVEERGRRLEVGMVFGPA